MKFQEFWFRFMKFLGPYVTRISSIIIVNKFHKIIILTHKWETLVKRVKWPAPNQIVVFKSVREELLSLFEYCDHHSLLLGIRKLKPVVLTFLMTYFFFKKKKKGSATYSTNLFTCCPWHFNAIITYLNSCNLQNRTYKFLHIYNLVT